MKNNIGRTWLWAIEVCSTQINNIYGGMALSFIVLMLTSTLVALKIALFITPIIVAFLGIYLTSKYMNIPSKIMFTNIKKYLPKNSFCAMMIGCIWVLICAAFL